MDIKRNSLCQPPKNVWRAWKRKTLCSNHPLSPWCFKVFHSKQCKNEIEKHLTGNPNFFAHKLTKTARGKQLQLLKTRIYRRCSGIGPKCFCLLKHDQHVQEGFYTHDFHLLLSSRHHDNLFDLFSCFVEFASSVHISLSLWILARNSWFRYNHLNSGFPADEFHPYIRQIKWWNKHWEQIFAFYSPNFCFLHNITCTQFQHTKPTLGVFDMLFQTERELQNRLDVLSSVVPSAGNFMSRLPWSLCVM